MRFRPCIDIHNGKVKQIVGGSLKDEGNQASTNFTSELDAAWYARQYQKDHLKGGHIILLNPVGSEYYEATKKQAMGALAAYPGGMQIGGGITADNAQEYLDSGASHVIVTSYVFQDGIFHEERLQKLVNAVGKEHVVLDLSCRRKDGKFYVVTDRWQKFTELALSHKVLNELSKYCDEFLIHGSWDGIPITYAGGIGSMEDLERFRNESGGKVDFTIGSALDLFGGKIPYAEVCSYCSLPC